MLKNLKLNDIKINEFYTIRQVSEILEVCYDTTRRYITLNKLRAKKVTIKGLKEEYRIKGEWIVKFNEKHRKQI